MKHVGDGKGFREPKTQLSHIGRAPAEHGGMVNVPVYRGSTIISETLEVGVAQTESNHELRKVWLTAVSGP